MPVVFSFGQSPALQEFRTYSLGQAPDSQEDRLWAFATNKRANALKPPKMGALAGLGHLLPHSDGRKKKPRMAGLLPFCRRAGSAFLLHHGVDEEQHDGADHRGDEARRFAG